MLDADFASGESIWVSLKRIDNLQTSVENLAGPSGYSNTGAWQEITDLSINFATINNNSHAYYVNVLIDRSGTLIRAGNIVIEYSYTSPGS